MKKILFVAISATLLAAGCQKTEIINSVNPNGTPEMTFTTGISKLTKSAIATGNENLQAQGFVLSAVNAYQDTPSGRNFNAIYDDLNNKQFTYSDDEWTYGGDSYFWPGKGRDLVFFAISSAQKENDGTQKYKVPTIGEEGFGILGNPDENTGLCENPSVANYVIKNYAVVTPSYAKTESEGVKVGDQTGADDDLMVADVVIRNQETLSKDGTKGQVDLAFNHTLSKVEFVFSTSDQTADKYSVVINSIVVNDVVKSADLTIGVNFTETADVADNTYDWDASEAATYATATPTNSESYTIDYPLNLTASEQTYATWLVIPQDLETKTVTISYTIKDATNNTSQNKNFVSVWPLKAEGIVDAWNINQYVKYKVILSPNIITFKPYLEKDWEEAKSVNPSTDETPVTPTYTEFQAGDITLYYEGTLEVGTVVYKKDNETYVKADAGKYGKYTIDADGKITAIAE